MKCLIRRNPEIVHSDMDGELVMMSIHAGRYYGLNGVGSQIWDMLEREMTADAICSEVSSRYDIDEKQCRSDVLVFLDDLLKNHVIEICSP